MKIAACLLGALLLFLLGMLIGSSPLLASDDAVDADKAKAVSAMTDWLATMDAGDYGKTWNDAAKSFQHAISSDQWVAASTSVRTPLGKLESRKLASAALQSSTTGIGMPKGAFVVAQFDTSFDNLKAARETVTFVKEADGAWRAAGYYIKPQ